MQPFALWHSQFTDPPSPALVGPLVQARADVRPIADVIAAAVCAAMALQVVTPLAGGLGEVKRVLLPGGLLVALVPSRARARPRGGCAGFGCCARLASQVFPGPTRMPAMTCRRCWLAMDSRPSPASGARSGFRSTPPRLPATSRQPVSARRAAGARRRRQAIARVARPARPPLAGAPETSRCPPLGHSRNWPCRGPTGLCGYLANVPSQVVTPYKTP
jgi:hypothetical protein